MSEISRSAAPKSDMGIKRIAVVGLGRFGQVWAELLATHAERGGYQVAAYNRTPRSFALPPSVKITAHIADAVAPAGLVFVCTAISSLPKVLPDIAPHLADGAIVCDTCSVKEWPQRWMRELLPKRCALLGTHPMFGPDSLREAGSLPLVYTPIRISEAALQQCTALFTLWGLRAIEMSARQHDRVAAYSQGFTHLIGRIAERMQVAPTEIDTLGYTKILQVMEQTCRDEWQLFVDIQRYNRYTKRMCRNFSRTVRDILRQITPR